MQFALDAPRGCACIRAPVVACIAILTACTPPNECGRRKANVRARDPRTQSPDSAMALDQSCHQGSNMKTLATAMGFVVAVLSSPAIAAPTRDFGELAGFI